MKLDMNFSQKDFQTLDEFENNIVENFEVKNIKSQLFFLQSKIKFENLINYIEAGEITPVVAQTFALKEIVAAQQMFEEKKFTGKLVLIPPQDCV